MKYALLVFFYVLYTTKAALLMADVYDLARECIKLKEVNGTEDDVNDILMGYLPDTKSGMCMLRCMESHVGILVNGTYDVRGAYYFFRTHFPENPFSKNMERGARFCGKIAAKRRTPEMDACQYAHMVAACIKRRIRYAPGSRTAFYNPFVWKNPFKKATIKPAKKYFEVDRKHQAPRTIFEIITKPPKKYTLDDIKGVLSSSESAESQGPHVYLPPRLRKGKRRKDQMSDRKGKKKKKKQKKKDSEDSESDSILDASSKTRRHQKKKFRI